MAIKKIVTREDELNTRCKDVGPLSEALPVAEDLVDTIKHLNKGNKQVAGGLAANQIGSDLRVIVIQYGLLVIPMINPRIFERSKDEFTHYEGCLSRPKPNLPTKVTRNQKIKVEYDNLDGDRKELMMKGRDAAVIQHEIDHLEGVLI